MMMARRLAAAVVKCQELSRLSLNEDSTDDAAALHLAAALRQLPRLQQVRRAATAIAMQLGLLCWWCYPRDDGSLRFGHDGPQVSLAFKVINADGAAGIASLFGSCQQLCDVNLSWNGVDKSGGQAMAAGLRHKIQAHCSSEAVAAASGSGRMRHHAEVVCVAVNQSNNTVGESSVEECDGRAGEQRSVAPA